MGVVERSTERSVQSLQGRDDRDCTAGLHGSWGSNAGRTHERQASRTRGNVSGDSGKISLPVSLLRLARPEALSLQELLEGSIQESCQSGAHELKVQELFDSLAEFVVKASENVVS